ncbi:MAG: hypothetical protein JRH20_00750 [Deltaproteobacteria bacterium]|nr:hypothetical protein [Deltaproteobacteria bacterium]
MGKSYKRHLRNYLLDRRFQLRFTIIIVLVAAVLTGGLGSFWYGEMRKASRMVEVNALTTMTDDEVKKVEDEMATDDGIRLGVLLGFGVLLALVLAGFSIIFTHRIAGPLFKISRHLRDLRDHNLCEVWDLRKSDQLQEFWAVFKETHTALRDRQEEEIQVLAAVLTKTEAMDGLQDDEAIKKLAQLRDRKILSLEPPAVEPSEEAESQSG